VRPRDLAPKDIGGGDAPTLLYGYGGFQVSMTPAYSGALGKLWIEPGGVYVMANIRGGGEFGPDWHQAALKETAMGLWPCARLHPIALTSFCNLRRLKKR